MSDMPTGKKPRTSGGPELPPEPSKSLPAPVRLNPMPEKKKKLKVKSVPLKHFSEKLVSISEDAPLLVDMDDIPATIPQPDTTKKLKLSPEKRPQNPLEDKPPTEYRAHSMRVHKHEALIFSAAPTPKPQEGTADSAKEVEDDTSAPAPKKEKSQKLKREPPASIYRPAPSAKREDNSSLDSATSGNGLSVDENTSTPAKLPRGAEDSGSKPSNVLLMAPMVLPVKDDTLAPAPKQENIPKLSRNFPASDNFPRSTEDKPATEIRSAAAVAAAAATGMALSMDDDAPAPAPEVKLKRNLPASKRLSKNEEEEPPTEFVELKSSTVSAEIEEINSLRAAAAAAAAVAVAAAAATRIALSVKDDAPAPKPKFKLKSNLSASKSLPKTKEEEQSTELVELWSPSVSTKTEETNSMRAATAATAAVAAAAAATAGIALSVEDDTPAPAPKLKLKRNLPSSKTLPKNEVEEPSTELEELWSPAFSTETEETNSLRAAGAPTGIALSVGVDTPAPAPKLKRNLPASKILPRNEEDEESTKFEELWSSVAPVMEHDTPALPSRANVSDQPADLEAGVGVPEKDGSVALWYKRKGVWALILSLPLLVILVTTIIVVTNNKDEVSSSSPTASPTSAPTVFTCTVCPDGSAPGNPDTVLDGWGGFTCEELDTVVSGSIFNATDCKDVQNSVAATCGCSRGEPTSSPAPNVFSPTTSPPSANVSSVTIVLQLDENPQETGWELACDGEMLESVEPGTYAIIGVNPNFRVEYETLAPTDSICELTVTDTGGDGLNGGYYEVYYGDAVNVGDPSFLLAGGTVSGSISTTNFTVTLPTVSKSTALATSFTGERTNCTVCPDGSAPGFPDALPEGWGGFTCEQLDTILSRSTTKLNPTDCKLVQVSAAYSCGCTNFCTTICPDGTSEPDPANDVNIVFIKNGEDVTCNDFQSQVASAYSNSKDQCLSANFIGEEICGCPRTGGFCRLCQDGAVPPPEALEREIVPGLSCLDLTGFAYALREADPSGIYFEFCPAYEAIGAYCGCEVSANNDSQFCRLCGGNEDLLPEPARLLNSTILDGITTCLHVEFSSNANATSTLACGEYQNDAASECCL